MLNQRRKLSSGPQQVSLPEELGAIVNPPDCIWRAEEEISERLKVSGTECICLSPRVKVHRYNEVRHPVLGSKITVRQCTVCIFRNEELSDPEYTSMMQSRWPERSSAIPSLRIRIRNFYSDIKNITKQWWSTWKNPLVDRQTYKTDLNICNHCDSLQPPEKPTTCCDCGCIVRVSALFKKKKCPLALHTGEAQADRGLMLLERSDSEVQRLREERAKTTVTNPGSRNAN